MFSMLQLSDAKKQLAETVRAESRYSPLKNEMSYDLVQMSTTDRGTLIEMMIVDTMNRNGIDAKWIGGKNSYDIQMFVNGKIVRAEVKSSMQSPKTGTYLFQGIKPDEWDVLFLAFVHPEKGVVVKSVSKSDFNCWCWNKSETKIGYQLQMSAEMTSRNVPTVEWNPEGEELTAA